MFARGSTSAAGNAARVKNEVNIPNGLGGASKNLKYPYRLNFYEKPPTEEITIEDFEVWAIDRLRVLAEIESCAVRNRSWEETKNLVGTRMKQYLPLSSNMARNTDLDRERRKDYISHYVLKLAFCRSEELRNKFVSAERTLFRIRWENEERLAQEEFMKSLNLNWEEVPAPERDRLAKALWSATPSIYRTGGGSASATSETWFKVHWTRVADLINQRRVFLHAGQAYVPLREQFTLILAEFSSRLTRSLEATSRALPRLDEDDRLIPVLEHLSMAFLSGVTSQYTPKPEESGELVTADMVDDLAKRHFPACMRHLHDSLRKHKHLKHFGRLQYNLFLKGIGLSVEEAMVFWRKGFAGISDDKFNKDYRYNIRHNYGLEGKRQNYQPKNCQRILTSDVPGPQDAHGCPYRDFSDTNLRSMLIDSFGIRDPAELKEITREAANKHYHVACTRVFEITHKAMVKKGEGLGGGESVTHPNLYFEKSRDFDRQQTMDIDAA